MSLDLQTLSCKWFGKIMEYKVIRDGIVYKNKLLETNGWLS